MGGHIQRELMAKWKIKHIAHGGSGSWIKEAYSALVGDKKTKKKTQPFWKTIICKFLRWESNSNDKWSEKIIWGCFLKFFKGNG